MKTPDNQSRLFKALKSDLAKYDSDAELVDFCTPGDADPGASVNEAFQPTAAGTLTGWKDKDNNDCIIPTQYWKYYIKKGSTGYSVELISSGTKDALVYSKKKYPISTQEFDFLNTDGQWLNDGSDGITSNTSVSYKRGILTGLENYDRIAFNVSPSSNALIGYFITDENDIVLNYLNYNPSFFENGQLIEFGLPEGSSKLYYHYYSNTVADGFSVDRFKCVMLLNSVNSRNLKDNNSIKKIDVIDLSTIGVWDKLIIGNYGRWNYDGLEITNDGNKGYSNAKIDISNYSKIKYNIAPSSTGTIGYIFTDDDDNVVYFKNYAPSLYNSGQEVEIAKPLGATTLYYFYYNKPSSLSPAAPEFDGVTLINNGDTIKLVNQTQSFGRWKNVDGVVTSDENASYFNAKIDISNFNRVNCPIFNSSVDTVGYYFTDEDDNILSYAQLLPTKIDSGTRLNFIKPINAKYFYYFYAIDSIADYFSVNRFDNIKLTSHNEAEKRRLINEKMDSESIKWKDANFIYQNMGRAFNSQESEVYADNHASWNHGCVANDGDDVVIFYNLAESHNIYDCVPVFRKYYPELDGFTDVTVIANEKEFGTSLKTQSSGVASNGDYLCLVGVLDIATSQPTGSRVYRSSDRGDTWTYTEMLDENADPIIADNGDITGFLLLSTGRILVMAMKSAGSDIYYSDDNGATWTTATFSGSNRTEPAWVELLDGSIVAYMRKSVAGDLDNGNIPAYYCKSTDEGETWTTPVASTSITNMTESNGQFIAHADGTYELIYHNRIPEDLYGSVYVAKATETQLLNDEFNEPIRISRLPDQRGNYVYDGIFGTGDAGYVGGCLMSDGNVFACCYSGNGNRSDIVYFIGKSKFWMEEDVYSIDPVTQVKTYLYD